MTQPDLARLEGLSTRLRAKRIDGDLNKENGFGRDRIPDPDGEEAATEIEALLARVRELTEALEPFATFADTFIDAEGWNGPMSTTRIVDWFGPSDFRAARAALTLNRSETDAG